MFAPIDNGRHFWDNDVVEVNGWWLAYYPPHYYGGKLIDIFASKNDAIFAVDDAIERIRDKRS